MALRFRALVASAALFAALGPLAAVHAQEAPTSLAPDGATSAALAQWHALALTHVPPLLHDAVAAMYADHTVDPSVANDAATAKSLAEQAALSDLDKSSQVLIERYFSQVQAQNFASLPYDSNSD